MSSATIALTHPEVLGHALAPSPWTRLAASGFATSLISAVDDLVATAVQSERGGGDSTFATTLLPTPSPAQCRQGFERTDHETPSRSPAGGEEEVARTIFSQAAAPLADCARSEAAQTTASSSSKATLLQTAEREQAMNDADNQEGGYLPCVAGDAVGDGRYTLVRELGRGESSKVWLATLTADKLAAQRDAAATASRAEKHDDEDVRMRSSPLRQSAGASQIFALKIYRCEERLQDSMAYERALMAFISQRTNNGNGNGSPAGPSSANTSAHSVSARSSTGAGTTATTASSSSAVLPDMGICSIRDDFVQAGPHGSHPCLVFDVLGPPVDWMMKEFDFQGITSRCIVIDVLRSTLRTLVALEGLNVIHTDLKPENLLFVASTDALAARLDAVTEDPEAAEDAFAAEALEVGDCAAPFAVRFIDFGLSYVIPPELRSSVTVTNRVMSSGTSPARMRSSAPAKLSAAERQLLHLGNYQKGAVIQTREYRAPEILLGTNFNTKADVWSLGCMAYELVTGQFLFDPKAHPDSVDDDAMDLRHLYEISALIGAPPASWLQRGSGTHTRRYFDTRTLKFLGARPLHRAGKINLAEDLVPYTARYAPERCREEAKALADFVLRCIQWDPSKRASPADLLDHPWLRRV